jgi:hypothetical protein
LAALLALAPALWLASLVNRYGVDVPYNDQWSELPVFEKAFSGRLTFHDLWEPHNEHRILFPRLVFIALARLTQWNVRAELAAIFLLAGVIAWNLFVLLRRTWPGDPVRALLLAFLVNLCVFSPIQHQNWLWGFQLQFLAPIACLTAVLALPEHWSARRFAAAAGALCVVSSFSLASGFLVWVATLPVWLARFPKATWARAGFLWMLGLAACLGLYLHGYTSPTHTFPLPSPFAEPRLFANVFLGLLGQPMATAFAKAWLAMAIALGLAGACLYAVSLWAVARSPTLRERPTTVAWACLGAHALLATGLVTLGRAGAGDGSVFASRYTTLTLPLWVSLFVLVLLLAEADREATRPRGWRTAVPLLAIGLLLAWSIPSGHLGRDDMEARFVRMSEGKARLVMAPLFPRQPLPDYLGAQRLSLLQKSAALEGLGVLRPAMPRGRDLEAAAAIQPGSCGAIEEVYPEQQRVRLLGVAWLPRPRTADLVVLTYRKRRGGPIPIAWADGQGRSRPELAQALGCETCVDAGWEARFRLPENLQPAVVEAWAYDVSDGSFCRLEGSYRLAP